MHTILKGRAYGTVTVGDRGQLVIPSGLRKALNIKPGDQLMVFAKIDKRIISLMHARDFSLFLNKAEKLISKLENRVAGR